MNSRIIGSMAFILRGVNARASRLRWMSWIGRIFENQCPGRNLDAGLDDLQHDTAWQN